jgi:hypothetical protein
MEEVSDLEYLLERYRKLPIKDQISFEKNIHDPTLEDREWHALNRMPPVYMERYNLIKARCVCVKNNNIAYVSKKVSPFNKSDFVDALDRLGSFKLSIMWDNAIDDECPPMLMSTSLDMLICHDIFWLDFKQWMDHKP